VLSFQPSPTPPVPVQFSDADHLTGYIAEDVTIVGFRIVQGSHRDDTGMSTSGTGETTGTCGGSGAGCSCGYETGRDHRPRPTISLSAGTPAVEHANTTRLDTPTTSSSRAARTVSGASPASSIDRFVFTRHTNDVTDEMADDVTGDLANLTDDVTNLAGRGPFALRCTLCGSG
jgi:hypothetical protein